MSDMKCPFCQQEYIIHKDDSCFGQQRCVCRNPNCEFDGWHFPVKLVSELIRTKELLDIESSEHELCHTQMLKTTEKLERTRKALDVAVDALVLYANSSLGDMANEALKQITTLEQKD